MKILNIEIKAKVNSLEAAEALLKEHHAIFRGTDYQSDIYFKVSNGRLKLRQGKIENSLIYYNRKEVKGLKESQVQLVPFDKKSKDLGLLLSTALGIHKTIKKKRKIYFIDNVKFHLDTVEGLGYFIEIEAIDKTGDLGKSRLTEQCENYVKLFGIKESQLIDQSYADMIQ